MTPVARARRRWLAAREMVRRANGLRDRGAQRFAMRVMARARAEYQQAMRAAEGWLAYRQMARAA